MKTSSADKQAEGLEDSRIYKLALTGLFAALSYVVFTFCRLKLPSETPPFIWAMRSTV